MSRVKDISMMRPMERYHYMHNTLKICTQCKVQKRLSSFFNKKDIIINKYCNKCNKMDMKKEVMKIVLSLMKDLNDNQNIRSNTITD